MGKDNGRLFVTGFGLLFLICSLGYQTLMWLKTGHWEPYSIVNGLLFMFPKGAWLNNPQDWLGLHWLLGQIHAGLAIFIGCTLVAAAND